MSCAIIDLGSNTIRLSVFRYEDSILEEGDAVNANGTYEYGDVHAEPGTVVAEIQ